MIEVLKEIILDFQETSRETGVPRRLAVQALAGKATVCIGVRRCGKSTYLFQLIRKLLDEGVSPRNILYLNFFDDRLHDLRHGNLRLVAEAYFALYPEKKFRETVYCFFDEIQAVSGWEVFVERLMRTENCAVYLTGSSAAMLSREIATEMRGRALSWELFPFSFREFLSARGIGADEPLSSRRSLLIARAFDDYLETGGFPEVIGLERRLRVRIHQEYFQAILFRDLVERHDVAHPRAVADLAHRLVDTTASLYTVNALTGYLKSLGHRAPKAAVSDYLGWFEDAFFLFTVRIFDASAVRRNTNPKKIYCVDHALVASVSPGILVNSGHRLENLVFLALRRVYPALFYYRTAGGREVDFVVPGPAGTRAASGPERRRARMLVQACESLADPRTRKREVAALAGAMGELGLKTGTIVTRGDTERIESAAGTISVTPAWRFLLELPEEADQA